MKTTKLTTKKEIFVNKFKYKILLSISLVFILSFIAGQSWGQRTWDGGGDGINWNSANNWDNNSVPLSTETVTISRNGTLTVTVDGSFSCSSLTIIYNGNTAGILTLTIPSFNSLSVTNGIVYTHNGNGGENLCIDVAGGTLNCASITMDNTGSNTEDDYLIISNSSSTVNVSGNITMNGANTENYLLFKADGIINLGGTLTGGSITSTDGGGTSAVTTGTVNYNGIAQTIANYTYNNLITSNTGVKTLAANTTIGGNLTIQTGSTLNLSTFTANRSANGGTLNIDGTSTLLVGNTNNFPTNYSNYTLDAGSTVNYDMAGTQTVNPRTYSNLILSGTSAKTITGVTTVNGNLTLSGTATATTAAALTVGGNLIVGNGTTFATGTNASWTLNVTGLTSVSGTLTLDNIGDKTFSNDVTINSGGVWNETGIAAINYEGNLQNNGTSFISNTGIHTFSGTAKIISGTTAIAIPNLTINGTTTNSGTLTVNTSIEGTSTLTNGATGTLNFGGVSITPTLEATAAGNTVNYSGAAQTIKDITYSNLILSGSNTKTFTAATTINGDLTINAGVVAALSTDLTHSANTITLGGVPQDSGSYGGLGSGATNINATFFTTTNGIINSTSCTGGYWIGTTNTDWNTTTNWCDGNIPTASTNVYIPNVTNKPIISTTAVCNNLTINTGSSLTISGTALTISGNFTNDGTFTPNSSVVTISVNFVNTGTFTASSSTVIFDGTAQTIAAVTFNNLTLRGSGVKTLTATPTVNGILSMEGTATVSISPTYGGSATLQYNTATARTAGAEWLNTFAATGGVIITNTGLITMNAAKVFNASVPLTINSGAKLATNNLQLTLGGNFINSGGTFTAGSSNIIISGTMGTQSIAGFTTTGTVSMTKTAGIATVTGNINGSNLTINGAGGTLNLGTGLTHTFTGNWTNTIGTLNGGTGTLRIAGNSNANGGVFICSTGTVNYNGTSGNQAIGGTILINYYNLNFTGAAVKTITNTSSIGVNSTCTVTSNLYCGSYFIFDGGTTTFNLQNGATLGIGDASGITTGGTTGNIRADTRIFSTSANYVYTGTVAQVTGNGLPATVNNLTINNSHTSGVTLTASVSINGTLTLTNGKVTTGANVITVLNPVSSSVNSGSATAYINGILEKIISGAGTHYFPVGDASSCGYHLFEMSSIVGTNPKVKVQFSCINAATTDGSLLTVLPINWRTELTSGLITSATMKLYGSEITNSHWIGETTTAQSGNYSFVNSVVGTGSVTATDVTLAVLNNPKWFSVGTPLSKTYYSYQNGNWQNPNTWTLDPSGTTYYNPYTYPLSSDDVYILNGRTVFAKNSDGSLEVKVSSKNLSIEYGSVLDIGTLNPHNFTTVSGQGLLRIKSNVFPTGNFTSFVASEGGTVNYYNFTGNLPSQAIYNNLWLTKDDNNSTSYTYTLINNLTLNGNLVVDKTNGTGTSTFTVGNSTTSLNININNDVICNADCAIKVGTFNTTHNMFINGNLTNTGTFDLTNNAPNVANTLGACNLTFTGTDDNYASINSTTSLYNFILNKGIEQTPILHIFSSEAVSPFQGGVSYSIRLITGTLKIGSNINIPTLVSSGNYDLPAEACFWFASNSTFVLTEPLVVYGKYRISDEATTSGFPVIVTRFNGEILIEGGTTTTNQFRPSVVSVEVPRGSFTITDGEFNVKGPQHAAGYAMFDWQFSETAFIMKGGVINVKDQNADGSLRIGSANYEVTGGDVNIIISTSGSTAKIETTVPFWNLNISRVASSIQIVQLQTLPLIVYNDFKILTNNSPTFNANSLNLTVGGDLILESGTKYITGNNTTTLNGTSGQEFQINGTITTDVAGTIAGLNNFTLSNTSATVLTASSQKTLIVNGITTISSLCSFEDNGNIVETKGTVSNSGTHISTGAGKFVLKGTANQSIQGDGTGIFGNLELNNSAGATFTANQIVKNTLTLTSGILDIGIYRLGLYDNTSSAINVSSPSATKMIRTAGNQSDGGVLKIYSSPDGTTFTFPVGIGTVYSPATISVASATKFGRIIVKPVNKEQPYALGTNNKLKLYWKVESVLFEGASGVTHKYEFPNAEVIPAGEIAKYYVGVYNPFTWTSSNAVPNYIQQDTPSAGIHTANFSTSYIDGEYTCGVMNDVTIEDAFPTNVTVFYSKPIDGINGIWSNPSDWSTLPDRSNTALSIPTANNPVVIGGVYNSIAYNHTVTVDPTVVLAPVAGSLILNSGSVLDLSTKTGCNFGALPNQLVGGTGTLRISSSLSTAEFPAGDFGAFIGSSGGTVEYYTSGVNFSLPTTSAAPTSLSLATYYNLNLMATGTNTITLTNSNLTVYNDFTSGSLTYTNLVLINLAAPKNLNIKNNLNVNGGNLQFSSSTNILTVTNNVNIASGATFEALVGSTANSLTVSGNITNNGTLNFKNGTGICNITFLGNSDNSFTGTNAVASTTLNYLTVNKGTTQSSVLTMNMAGNLNVGTLPNKWLTITNGTFRFAKPAPDQTVTLSTDAYTIPATGCLSINETDVVVYIGYLNSDNSDLLLSGKLEVKKGTVNIGRTPMTDANNNDIEYASAGSPEISIETGGVLNVNGQIRYSTTTTSGALIYNQTGGDVTIYGNSSVAGLALSLTRAKLTIHNAGSIFNMSGGNITIKKGSGTVFSDLYIRPESSSVSGGTINFNASSVGNQTYKLDAEVPLFNVTLIGAASNTSTVTLNVNDLVLKGSLTISDTYSTLIANNLDITIGKNFTKSGTYTHGTNTTTFNGTEVQNITCNNATTFNNLTINKSSEAASLFGTNPTVNKIFDLSDGIFDTKACDLDVKGNVVNSGTHVSNGSGKIILSGSLKQFITGDGSGSFANLTISNTNGIEVNTDLEISKQLNFQNGMFYVDDNLLTFTETAPVPTGITSNQFITTNGVASDAGIKKIFSLGNQSFTFPIGALASGTSKYTPVTYTLTDLTGTRPFIQVKPINSKHLATTDISNNYELNYYWNVNTSSDFTVTALTQVYTYLQSDVQGTETAYISGRLPKSETVWVKGTIGDVDEDNPSSGGTITFTNISKINGDYTAGQTTEFETVYIYRSKTSGNWINNTGVTVWQKSNDGGSNYNDCSLGDYPIGNPTIIQAPHTITATSNGYSALSLDLKGTLDLVATTGHNFVTLSGNGRLIIKANGTGAFVFPGGDNSIFMNTTGSTIEYNSTTGSTISPVITTYQNIELSGGGEKSLANVNLSVNGNFTIASNCGQFTNEGYDKNITVNGNWVNNSLNSYKPGLGTVFFTGASSQQITGNVPTEVFYNTVFENTSTNGTSLDRDISIGNDLIINLGAKLTANDKSINIKGNWTDNAVTDLTGFIAGTGTVNFYGTSNQSYDKSSGEIFNNLTVGNLTGLTANCNTTINGILDFAVAGKLMISSNLLTLNSASNNCITNYDATRFIQTNGLASDAGVTKIIASSPYDFTFPVGTGTKYTPAQFVETNGAGGSGEINVIPVNSKHPFASNNITDELQYYWIVTASASITPKNLTHTYKFDAALPSVSGYVPARFYLNQWTPSRGISVADGGTVSTTQINLSVGYITGEYTCGTPSNFGIIKTYFSRSAAPNILLAGADWKTLSTWSTTGHDDDIDIPSTPPNANAVIIKEGHKVIVYEDDISISSLELKGNTITNVYSELQLNATSGHYFGSITGKGILSMKNIVNDFILPTANISTFVSSTGGTIKYDGVGNLPAQATYNNLILTDNYNKNLPNLNLIINGNLTIDNGQLTNSFGKDISIKKNWIDNVLGGGFVSNAGKVTFNGVVNQTITSNGNTKFWNLEIDNATGLILNSPVEIANFLYLKNGKINTSSSNILYLSNSNSNVVSGSGMGTTSWVQGPLNKNIGSGGSFTFPIGSNSIYGYFIISNSTSGTWQAEYHANNLSGQFNDPLVQVSSTEYWRVQSFETDGSAKIAAPYGPPSGILSKWTLANFISSKWNILSSSSSTSTGNVSSINDINFYTATDQFFTIATDNLVKWLGTVSTDWFTAANWSNSAVPTSADNVKIFDISATLPTYYYPVIDGFAETANLTIDAATPTPSLTIGSTGSLTTNGELVVAGNLTIKSNATSTGSLITNGAIDKKVTGKITVERFLAGNKWHFMYPTLSLIPTSTYSKEGGYTNYNFYNYNESKADYWNSSTMYGTSGWTGITAPATISTEKGFNYNRYQMGDKNFIQTGGTLFTGNKIFNNITYTPHTLPTTLPSGCTNNPNYYDGWNLMGNPYPCGIDWEQVDLNQVGGAGIEAAVYLYDGTAGKYKYYIKSTGSSSTYDLIAGLNANSATQYIPIGQGFMVKAKNSAISTTSFTVPESSRVHNFSQQFYKNSTNVVHNILRMEITKNGYTDETVIRTLPLETGVTDNHDGNFDAYKMFGWDKTVPQIYTTNTNFTDVFAINSVPEFDIIKQIPIGIFIGTAGQHTINFTENTFDSVLVYLEDKSTTPSTFVNINATPTYTFTQVAGSNTARFVLNFRRNHAPVTTDAISNQTVYEDVQYTFTANVNFTDSDLGDIVTITAEYPQWLSFNPATKTFTGNPDNSNVGIYTIKIIGTDLALAKTEITYNLQVINVNDVPVLTNSIQNQFTNEDEQLALTVPENLFTDIDLNDVLTYSATLTNGNSLPEWLTFNSANKTFYGIPKNEDVSTYNIMLLATDLARESVSEEFSLTVINVNDAPILEIEPGEKSVLEDVTTVFALPLTTFSDPDLNDILTYSVSDLPEWLTFNPENLEFISHAQNSDVGSYIIVLTASDLQNFKTDAIIKIEVLNVNDAPILNGTISDSFVNQDEELTINIPENLFTDIDFNDVLTYSATLINGNQLPLWITFNADNMTLSGIPSNEDVGTNIIRLQVSDLAGELVYTDFALYVLNVNDAPIVINQPSNKIVLEDAYSVFAIPASTFSDPDLNDVLTYTVSQLPSWITFNSGNLEFTAQPRNNNVGFYVITLTATDLSGKNVSTSFILTVENTNDAPYLINEISDIELYTNDLITVEFGKTVFADIDPNDNLTYDLTLADDTDLPEWLTFDIETNTLTAMPLTGDEGIYEIKVTATDNSDASASTTFRIDVKTLTDIILTDKGSISVYPNPSTGIFKVKTSEQIQGADYKLFDITGKQIKTGKITDQILVLDLTVNSKGAYTLTIISGANSYPLVLIHR